MRRILIALLSLCLALPPVALGASVTITDDSCKAFTTTTSGGSVSVTCVGSVPAPVVVTPPPAASSVAVVCAAAGFKSVLVYEMGWSSHRVITSGFNSTTVAVFHIHTSVNPTSVAGHFSAVEYQDGPRKRHATISTAPCDFSRPAPVSVWNAKPYSDSSAPIFIFTVGGVTNSSALALRPDTDYYVNVQNDPVACQSGAKCDMFGELATGQ